MPMKFYKWLKFLLIISGITRVGFAQNYTGSGGAIPDNGNSVDFYLNVNGLSPPNIDTSNFGLESVCINITHTYDSDLDISLIAPDRRLHERAPRNLPNAKLGAALAAIGVRA